jgi:uncharacterized beta-barrel protein YwiB (DUF1934 family)
MNEGKKVSLHTRAVQRDSNGSQDKIEFYAEAKQAVKNGVRYVSYKETALSGMEGTSTILRIAEDTLSILRFGAYRSKLEFKQGEERRTLYQTPYGTMEIHIRTQLLTIAWQQDESCSIHLKYSLESTGQEALSNELHISIR